MSLTPPNPDVEKALRHCEAAALNFAWQAISISHVRVVHVRPAQDGAASLRLACRTGAMSAKAAAETAYGMRAALLRLQREKATALGRALAVDALNVGQWVKAPP